MTGRKIDLYLPFRQEMCSCFEWWRGICHVHHRSCFVMTFDLQGCISNISVVIPVSQSNDSLVVSAGAGTKYFRPTWQTIDLIFFYISDGLIRFWDTRFDVAKPFSILRGHTDRVSNIGWDVRKRSNLISFVILDSRFSLKVACVLRHTMAP